MNPFEYSIVIPVYNEQGSLGVLWGEVSMVMRGLEKPFEVIFVNDGSSDQSAELLSELKRSWPEQIKVIHLMQRRGQTFALRQGLQAAQGTVVITLDADLQNDPADIPKLLAKLNEGYDVVCGWRKQRQDQFLKTLLSKLGNVLQQALTRLSVHDVSCTLRAYQRSCVARIPLNWEGQHRFIPLCLALQGLRVGEVVVNHRERKFGSSKYSHKRIFRVMTDFGRILKARGRE